MLVQNESTRVHVVPVQEKPGDRPARQFTLMPGVNDVADTDWGKAKALKMINVYLEEGSLRELDGSPLSRRTAKEAAKIVKDTYDKGLLLKWREDDKRQPVQDAIAAQLKSITPTPDELNKAGKGEK